MKRGDKMKPGDIVMIYEDPITQQKEEGRAKLIKQLFDSGDGQPYWLVEFLEDNYRCQRFICNTP